MPALAVLKDDLFVGHLPRQLSPRLSQILLARNGTIDCIVTGGRRYSVDLLQKGLAMSKQINF